LSFAALRQKHNHLIKKHRQRFHQVKDSYGRGVGYPWKFGDKFGSLDQAKERCEKAEPLGCEKSGLIYYPKCKQGYHAFGCCICVKDADPTPKEDPPKPQDPPKDAGLSKDDAAPVSGIANPPSNP